MEKVNLHTHTARCRHGSGTVADCCVEAVRQGIGILGISEHQPFPDNRLPSTRMIYTDFPAYLAEVEAAGAAFPDLEIFCGVECEYEPDVPQSFYSEYRDKYHLDYMIGSVHHAVLPDGTDCAVGRQVVIGVPEVRAFVESYLKLLDYGYFLFLGHPDMCAISIEKTDREIDALFRELISAAKSCGVPLEINAYGLRKPPIVRGGILRQPYPWLRFWELAAEIGDVPCVAFSDAHTPADVWGNTDDAAAIAGRFGLPLFNGRLGEFLLQKRRGDAIRPPRNDRS